MDLTVTIPNVGLKASLVIPSGSKCIIVFIHGSGSNRFSDRNQYLSRYMNDCGFATLRVDMLTNDEKIQDLESHQFRFNIELLTNRLRMIITWLRSNYITRDYVIGLFASSSGAAAAIKIAIEFKEIRAIVLKGGRLDYVNSRLLKKLIIPTMLIVGSNDVPIVTINQIKYRHIPSKTSKSLVIVRDARHFLDEPNSVAEVQRCSVEWFNSFLLEKYEWQMNTLNKVPEKSYFGLLYDRIKTTLSPRFSDRESAGLLLSNLLSNFKDRSDAIILGIPNGGCIVAHTIAEKLHLKNFEAIPTKRLQSPTNSEVSFGAMVNKDYIHLNSMSKYISKEFIEKEIQRASLQITNKFNRFLYHELKNLDFSNKTVLLVDDGVYTGSSIIASILWIRTKEPKQIVVAVPVITLEKFQLIKTYCDRIEYIFKPLALNSVEDYYCKFDQITDKQIFALYEIFKNRHVQ